MKEKTMYTLINMPVSEGGTPDVARTFASIRAVYGPSDILDRLEPELLGFARKDAKPRALGCKELGLGHLDPQGWLLVDPPYGAPTGDLVDGCKVITPAGDGLFVHFGIRYLMDAEGSNRIAGWTHRDWSVGVTSEADTRSAALAEALAHE